MSNDMRPITELIAERQRLAQQLAVLDAQLFQRVESMANTMLNMLGGAAAAPKQVAPHVQLPLPPPAPLLPPAPAPAHLAAVTAPIPPWLRQAEAARKSVVPLRVGDIGTVIKETAKELILELGRPVKTREVYDYLVELGVSISGKDPLNNLSAHLSRSDAFTNTNEGWSIKK